jgi:hypothetical protein
MVTDMAIVQTCGFICLDSDVDYDTPLFFLPLIQRFNLHHQLSSIHNCL